jgi:beta-phosphoglucomutase
VKLALFFDLDGTLVDSEPMHWQAWRSALKPLGIGLTWAAWLRRAVGHPDTEILSILLPKSLVNTVGGMILREKEKEFLRLAGTREVVTSSVRDLLWSICEHPIAVVTSSPRKEALRVLEMGGIADVIRVLVTLNDVQNVKPHPEPYLRAMASLKVRCGLAFEDSNSGMSSAVAAGLSTSRISNPAMLPTAVRSAIKERESPYRRFSYGFLGSDALCHSSDTGVLYENHC